MGAGMIDKMATQLMAFGLYLDLVSGIFSLKVLRYGYTDR
jgi:hypothetical protein